MNSKKIVSILVAAVLCGTMVATAQTSTMKPKMAPKMTKMAKMKKPAKTKKMGKMAKTTKMKPPMKKKS
jgi:Ni/Co efflux regulator RcnB